MKHDDGVVTGIYLLTGEAKNDGDLRLAKERRTGEPNVYPLMGGM